MGTEFAANFIVVGIDGSSESYDALAWAAHYAQLRGSRVTAVLAWEYPATYGFYLGPELWDLSSTSQTLADEEVDKARHEYPNVEFEVHVIQGRAAQVLVEQSVDADLLVVGSRGRGGFAGMLLGSTSTHCVHAAHCPVLVCR